MINIPNIKEMIGFKPDLIQPLVGGDINQVYKINYVNENYILKLNNSGRYPNLFEKEVQGLEQLRSSNSFKIPSILETGEFNGLQYLLMEYIEKGESTPEYWSNFAKSLAQLHSMDKDYFGNEIDNYIGTIHQSNTKHENWSTFFIQERCQPLVKLSLNQGYLTSEELKLFSRFYLKVPEIWPHEKPALLHGDLWSGNHIVGKGNQPVLIDPAVYFGHREMDLGMMHLFGGFPSDLFHLYHSYLPLEKGWEQRIKYNQLYPLLVHLNLFGLSYKAQVMAIISEF